MEYTDGHTEKHDLGLLKLDYPDVVAQYAKENKLGQRRIWKVPADPLVYKGDRIIAVLGYIGNKNEVDKIKFNVCWDHGLEDDQVDFKQLKKKAAYKEVWVDGLKQRGIAIP